MSNSIFKVLFLPGTISFFLILIGTIGLIKLQAKWGKILLVLGLGFYYFCSITPGADLLIGVLEADYMPLAITEVDQADKVVVLTGGRKANILRSFEVIRISALRDHNIELIVAGTEMIDKEKEEASGIELLFINRGIPAENIYIEDVSRNTRENAERVIAKIGDAPFFLVTSAYHMKRAVREFKKLQGNPIPAPTDFRVKRTPYHILDYIPDSDNIKKSDLSFYEYFGLLYYQIFD